MRVAPELHLTATERLELDRLCSEPKSPPKLALRAWIVLRASQGAKNRDISKEFLIDPGTVALWRRRFLVHRIAGILSDAPRPGRRPRIPAVLAGKIVAAFSDRALDESIRTSSRDIARRMGVSQSTVIRIWKMHGGKIGTAYSPSASGASPPRVIRDVRGVYISAHDRSVVFVVRTPEAGIPTEPKESSATPARSSLPTESSRKGGRDPLAAVRVLYRTIVPAHPIASRTKDFLLFLRGIYFQLAPGEEAHILLRTDTLGKETALLRWLRRHPEFHLYLTPVELSGERLDFQLPEGLTVRGVREGSLRSLPQLIESFRVYSTTYRQNPRPFVWGASGPGPSNARLAVHPPRRTRRAPSASWPAPVTPGSVLPIANGKASVEPIIPGTSMAFLPIRAGLSGGYAGRIDPLGPADPAVPDSPQGPTFPNPVSPKGISIPEPLAGPEPRTSLAEPPANSPRVAAKPRSPGSDRDPALAP